MRTASLVACLACCDSAGAVRLLPVTSVRWGARAPRMAMTEFDQELEPVTAVARELQAEDDDGEPVTAVGRALQTVGEWMMATNLRMGEVRRPRPLDLLALALPHARGR